ncbi:hypothetical protein RXV86_21640 [Alisedimentitalea sp. MJ-SS2]|uniref:hypothetical protein n=1 Tax=Aliisedimentitalea sp. MJ-SS2 TaxID=3049795 RepID=UPI0029079747|nr:hypothetical protein [Alisedimentitalea sp. MJ-SS2]MDU8929997.1 hypothetical protein [Alisedimentitalea sp. MJ-SS2]
MRPVLTATLILAVATPALAESKRQREKRCAAQADIIAQAVEMRVENKEKVAVTTELAAAAKKKIATSVPILVDYVYSLDEALLEQDIRTPFEEQCNGFKQ